MPERNQELARQRHDADFMPTLAAGVEVLLIPQAECALWLMAQPAPGDFDGHRPHQIIAGLADPLFVVFVAALKGCRGQAGQGAEFAAVMKVAPGEELHDEEPGRVLANAFEPQQLAYLGHGRFLRLADRRAAFGFQFQDLLLYELPAGELAAQARDQTVRQGCAIPEAQLGQVGQEVAIHVEVDALADQQAFNAIHVARAFNFQGEQLAVKMALILGRQAGHLHHAPHAGLAAVVAQEHGQQLFDVQAVGLGVLAAATDLDAGRVHHQVGHVLVFQEAVQPETVATSFVATQHRRVGRQAEPLLGQRDFLLECGRVARGDLALPWVLAVADREAQFPILVAQLKGQVQRGACVFVFRVAGGFHGILLSVR